MLRVSAAVLCCAVLGVSAGSAHPVEKRVQMHECHNAGVFALVAAEERDGGRQLSDVIKTIRDNEANYPNSYYASLTQSIVRYSFAHPQVSPGELANRVKQYCERQLGEMSEDETTW